MEQETTNVAKQEVDSEVTLDVKKEIPKQSGLAAILGDVYFVREEKPKTSTFDRARDEIEIYKTEPSIPLHASPLKWWSEHEFANFGFICEKNTLHSCGFSAVRKSLQHGWRHCHKPACSVKLRKCG